LNPAERSAVSREGWIPACAGIAKFLTLFELAALLAILIFFSYI
jgi:hypothetical protein